MKFSILLSASVLMCIASIAKTEPMPLSTYTDAKGYLDVQAFTCGQLANTYQEDADMLAAWYSGWYNGLAKKHFAHVGRVKSGEHRVIVYCKAHPDVKVIQAIDLLFKSEKN
ncbi:HdeA/HdeB family chaperone [Nitrobacter winogradskyi]|nr:HdeA/HdeB family chaperone [Nitrobacter winogradskyi]